MSCGIYAIEHIPSGKRYIGRSGGIEYRWQQHISALKHNRHSIASLQEDWNRDDMSAFRLVIIEEIPIRLEYEPETSRIPWEREMYHMSIRWLKTGNHGYNKSGTVTAEVMAMGIGS